MTPVYNEPIEGVAASARMPGATGMHAGLQNGFDVLRLLLATAVLYSHSYHLGGFGEERFSRFCRGQTIAGAVGVLGFFGLSGFLVTLSYERCPTPWEFLRRRARQILPGYWACLIVTAFVASPLIGWLRDRDPMTFPWTGPNAAWGFVVQNSICASINGRSAMWSPGSRCPVRSMAALWSLFPETLCYLGVCLAGVCGALRQQRLLLIVLASVFAAFHLAMNMNLALQPPTLPTFLALTPFTPFILAFLTGSLAAVYRTQLTFNWRGALLLGVVIGGTLKFGGYAMIAPVVLPLFLLHLAYSFSWRLQHDFSYGLYIYGFVAQQLIASVTVFRSSPLVFFAASLLVTLAFAIASWFGIERRFLPRSRHA